MLRPAVAAGAGLGEVVRTHALEVRPGEVVEDQLGLEAEEIAEPGVQRHFDPVFGGEELVEGARPGVKLAGRDTDPPALVPVREEASALTVADEVGFQSAGEPVRAGRREEPVGDEHEGAVGERDDFGPSEVLVEEGPEAPLVEQGADDEDGPPVGGIADLGSCRIAGLNSGF